ncbi:hypothetical protein GP486_000244 [Trichoglossum hirsutum]|uniref:Uncharacterized protein n=1 Tax=Trichoglossum hirsutum TaxID=265104 RepID=A0A9P8LJB1_9PEZI|nr:hypothetical protein GP486_000244 [Trichoglossum hirsutum]
MAKYDYGTGVWALVIGYQLTYGYHQFEFAVNPWRPGEEYEQMRPAFQKRYQEAIKKISTDCSEYLGQKAANKNPYPIYLCDLLV